MTRLKLHYDGWLVLPATFRRALDLGTGAPLEAELVDGAIVLRPVAKATAKARAAAAAEPEQAASGGRAGEPPPAPRRKPGRPRKASTAEQPAPALKLEPEDEPSPRGDEVARSELRPKETPPAAETQQSWALVRDPRPERRGPDGHGEREKRPFRQVEVRKLGPGRGHNQDGICCVEA